MQLEQDDPTPVGKADCQKKESPLIRGEAVTAVIFLAIVLNLVFFPVTLGDKTLMSATETASVMPYGAFNHQPVESINPRQRDMVACTELMEPWYMVLKKQYWHEHVVPLWNQYSGYGMPLLANMESQPLFPLTIVLSLFTSLRACDLFVLARLFIAGLTAFLYFRRFVEVIPALAGAVSFMLTGYFVLFVDMPELSVGIMLPSMLWGIELLLSKRTTARLAMLSAFVALSLLGGMPEVSFLTISFAFLYGTFRILTNSSSTTKVNSVKTLLIAFVMGFALAAPLILPFYEYMHNSSSSLHDPAMSGGNKLLVGLRHDKNFSVSVLTYLVPLIYGKLYHSTLYPLVDGERELRGYWGFAVSILAFLSVTALVTEWRSTRGDGQKLVRVLTMFFALAMALMLLKRYGSPIINWLGALPIANMVWFPKYEEVLLGFAASALAAFGLARLSERTFPERVASRAWKAALFVAPSILVLTFALLLVLNDSRITKLGLSDFEFLRCAKSASLTLAITLSLYFLSAVAKAKMVRCAQASFLLLITCELFFNFVYPCSYRAPLPRKSEDPYLGAPYIDFLKGRVRDQERVLGIDKVLAPNWASVFSLFDVRANDGLYPPNYIAFIRFMFTGETTMPEEFGDFNLSTRFIGNEAAVETAAFIAPFQKDSAFRRFATLSSVRYLLSMGPMEIGPIMAEIFSQNSDKISDLFKCATMSAGGVIRGALFLHPLRGKVSNSVIYKVHVPEDRQYFTFAYAIASEAALGGGDGAGFTIVLADGHKKEELFRDYLNPRSKPGDMGWHHAKLDVGAYRGKNVQLIFSTEPGPQGDNSYDHCGFADLEFQSPQGIGPSRPKGDALYLKPIYDKEVHIYRIDNILPRAGVFSNVLVVPSAQEELKTLISPSFDPFSTVVIDRADLSADDERALTAISVTTLTESQGRSDGSDSPSVPANPAASARSIAGTGETEAFPGPVQNPTSGKSRVVAQKIDQYLSQLVRIKLDVSAPGILMLNDSAYPGWKAYVDGQERKVVRTNYLFRGVLVKPGDRELIFKYDPLSFKIGLAIALIGAGFLIVSAPRMSAREKIS